MSGDPSLRIGLELYTLKDDQDSRDTVQLFGWLGFPSRGVFSLCRLYARQLRAEVDVESEGAAPYVQHLPVLLTYPQWVALHACCYNLRQH